MKSWLSACLTAFLISTGVAAELRGTGDLGLVIERATGSIQIFETTGNTALGRVEGLGDLSHASAVFSRDERFAYIFGRDGGLSKIDMLERKLVARTIQSGNSIGGAISQDGSLIAVSNYEPGGVKIFDAVTLELVADIPATWGNDQRSKVIGLVDAPGNRFVYALWEAGEIWLLDASDRKNIKSTQYKNIGQNPYDGMVTPDGRYYIAGLFGEDGIALLDLWQPELGVKRILPQYGPGTEKLPVYKMPHLEGWAFTGDTALVPAVGQHQVLVVNTRTWQEVGRIDVKGQPVFVVGRPDGRYAYVNFALPDNGYVQIIDTLTLKVVNTLNPGPGVLHMEFEPKGEQVWVSVRDGDFVQVLDTTSLQEVTRIPANKPSGIFLTDRAQRIGR